MAHKIIGYFTLEQIGKILNKWFYFYSRSEYCYGIKITNITSVEANAKFAVCVFNDSSHYVFGFITSARTAFDITYEGVSKYSSYPSGNLTDPPKDPDSTWTNVVDFGPNTSTITPSSSSVSIYPNTLLTFPWATINVNNYGYADSDGCVRIWDDAGILNDWDTSVAYSNTNQKNYILNIMGKSAIPKKGRGTVTLDIPANGQYLTFNSAELSVQRTVFVDKNTSVDLMPTKSVNLKFISDVDDVITVKDSGGNVLATVNCQEV